MKEFCHYVCSGCHATLFTSKEVIEHHLGTPSTCQGLFITKQNWISEATQHYSATPARGQKPGIIECPRKHVSFLLPI
jgi:hypothetical protein